MDDEQLAFDHLRKLVTKFQEERRKMVKKEWYGSCPLLRRLFRPEEEYSRLMTVELCFFHGMQRDLRNVIGSKKITAEQLKNFLVTLKAHISGLQGRHKILVAIGGMIVVMATVLPFAQNPSAAAGIMLSGFLAFLVVQHY